MSLINKMLADLEHRAAEVQRQADAKPVLEGLRAANEDSKWPRRRMRLWMVMLCVALGVAAAQYYPRFKPSRPALPATPAATMAPHVPPSVETTPAAAVVAPSPPAAAVSHPTRELDVAEFLAGPGGALGAEAAPSLATASPTQHASTMADKPADDAASAVAAQASESVRVAAGSISRAQPQTATHASTAELPATKSSATQGRGQSPAQRGPSRAPTTSASTAAPTTASAMPDVAPATTVPSPATAARRSAPVTPVAQSQPLAPVAEAEHGAVASAPTPRRDTVALAAEPSMTKAPNPLTPAESAELAYQDAAKFMQAGRMAEAEDRLRAALRSDARHVPALQLLGGLLLNQGRVLEAQNLLESATRQQPGVAALNTMLARIYFEQGAASRAVGLLELRQASAQNDPDYWALLAAGYQQLGRFADCAVAYQRALAQRPDEGRWWLGLGIAHESVGQPAAAREAYQHALVAERLPAELVKFLEQRLARVEAQLR